MKERTLFVLTSALLLTLASCGGEKKGNSSSAPVSEPESSVPASSSEAPVSSSKEIPVSSSSSAAPTSSSKSSTISSSSKKEAVKLVTPVISVKADKSGLSVAAVEHATKIQIKVDDAAYVDGNEHAFSATAGAHVIKVKAVGDGTNYRDSDEATYNYETKAVALTLGTVDGLTVPFTKTAMKVEAAFNRYGDNSALTYAEVSASEYTAPRNGKVFLKASGGYDEAAKVFYSGTDAKSAWAIVKATENKVLFDADSEVADDITPYFYDTAGWAAAGGHAKVSVKKVSVDDKDPVVNFHIQRCWNYKMEYKFAEDKGIDAYESIAMDIRGDGMTKVHYQFYAASFWLEYSLGVIPTNWQHIEVRTNADGWKAHVGNQEFTIEQFASAQGVTPAQLLAACDSMALIMATTADAKYSYTNIMVKNVTMLAASNGDFRSTYIAMQKQYTGKVGDVTFKMELTGFDATLSTMNLAEAITVSCTGKTTAETTFELVSKGADATKIVFDVLEGGRELKFKSATGGYAAQVNGLNLNAVYLFQNFESYEAQGVGYDKNNTADKRSGLRADWLAEYYAGSGSSPISGNNWNLMGSSDYIGFSATGGHNGSKAIQFKENTNAMRYSNYNLYDGTALALPKADTISFWVKNPGAQAGGFTVRMATNPKTTISNMGDAIGSVKFAANSDWAQYTVAINPQKTYYGVVLSFDKTASGTNYVLVDDIEMYTTANPYDTYVAPEPEVDDSPIKSGTVMNGKTNILSDVSVTFGDNSTVAIAAGGNHYEGTYALSEDKKIQIKIGDGSTLTYLGQMTDDLSVIHPIATSGTLATACDGLAVKASKTQDGKVIVEDFENGSEAELKAKYSCDVRYGGSGTFSEGIDNSELLTLQDLGADAGFHYMNGKVFAADNQKVEARFRFAGSASFGKAENLSVTLRNNSNMKLNGGVWLCTTAGNSAKGRVQSSIWIDLPANSDWTTFTGTTKVTGDIYGFSVYLYNTATSGTALEGSVSIGDVLIY